MKQFIKVLKQNKQCFLYLKVIFPKTSDAKIEEGMFVGSKIRKFLDNKDFEATIDELELAA